MARWLGQRDRAEGVNLDMCIWVDLVYRFAGCSACLAVQIETLHENTVVTETSDPYVTFTVQTQLNTFTDVQPDDIQQTQYDMDIIMTK